jgi:hypothetical protein
MRVRTLISTGTTLRRGLNHARSAMITLALLIGLGAGIVAALWIAGFLLYASQHHNPLHAGVWGWIDAVTTWHQGGLPKQGRRLVAAGVMGLLVAFGGPVLAWWGIQKQGGRRELYGSARFASEADVRRAGLL